MAYTVLYHCLDCADLRRHKIMHVRFVSSIYEKHTDDGHTCQDEARRYKQDCIDSGSEVVELEMARLSASHKDLHQQGQNDKDV